jgi:molecular chaperone IbpA
MRNNVDLSPFRRSTVGFDRLFDMLESGMPGSSADNYPPFDLVREDEDHHRIHLAVAGFKPDEIEVEAQQNQLVVSGRKPENDNTQYIHRGIATRNFERRFALADYVQVKNANLSDGLLSVELVREIPEAVKPRKIEIGAGASRQQQIEGSSRNANENDEQHAA